jgi:FkbM family methyltransferase
MASNIELAATLRGYFPPEYKGVLLEVGAAHPINISLSHPFRSSGWKIISVEPNPEYVKEFTDMGLECLPYACCAEDKGRTDFYVSPCPESCSALEVRYLGCWPASEFKVIKVEALTLNTIMKKHHPSIDSIDILIVDTEGWELEVLKGFDLVKFSPRVVVIEELGVTLISSYMGNKNYFKDREEIQDMFYVQKD